jgi:hypothetical protein
MASKKEGPRAGDTGAQSNALGICHDSKPRIGNNQELSGLQGASPQNIGGSLRPPGDGGPNAGQTIDFCRFNSHALRQADY